MKETWYEKAANWCERSASSNARPCKSAFGMNYLKNDTKGEVCKNLYKDEKSRDYKLCKKIFN